MQSSSTRLSSKDEAAISAVLKRFSEAYVARDADAALALFLPEEETVMIGSGEEEISLGFSEVKRVMLRQFAEWDALSFELKWGSALGRGPIAWVATVVSATDSRQRKSTGRFTAVLEQRHGRWLFVQTHFSFPVGFGGDGST